MEAVARAAPTLLGDARPMTDEREPLDLWRRAFALTYSAELRAERKGRAGSVVDTDPERYRASPRPRCRSGARRRGRSGSWRWRRREGKALSVAPAGQGERDLRRRRRLSSPGRSTATPGREIELKPWQRRHPLLARDQPFAAAAEERGGSLAWPRERRGDRAGERADGERLAQQLVAAQVVGLAFADIAGDEQHREVAVAGRFQMADQLGAGHLGHDHVGDDEVELLRA